MFFFFFFFSSRRRHTRFDCDWSSDVCSSDLLGNQSAAWLCDGGAAPCHLARAPRIQSWRSEEHTSELQSQSNLVCRLLLEKKKRPLPLTTRVCSRACRREPPASPVST